MTRIADFGRKRTHLEAGFSDDSKPEGSRQLQTINGGQHVQSTANESVTALPPKKKRKRTKPSMRDGNTGVKAAQAAAEREQREAKARLLAQCKDTQMLPGKLAKKKRNEVFKDKGLSSEYRRQRRIQEKIIATTCFACREKGHAAKDCPLTEKSNNEDGIKTSSAVGMCYRCGSKRHTLSRCKKPLDPLDPLPFALCFVCNEKGHLASSCPQNESKGVYPNGGCCKLCGETSHLAKDCHQQKQDNVYNPGVVGTDAFTEADEDGFHAINRHEIEQKREQQRTQSLTSHVDANRNKTRVKSASLPSKKIVYF